MAFSSKQIDYYHERGNMPDRYWAQQNGKDPEWNLEYQRRQNDMKIRKQEKIKKCEEVKKQIQQQIYNAIIFTMNEGSGRIAAAAANDIINSVNAACGIGSVGPKGNMSFFVDLGIILGKALGQAPFKLLDQLFNDEYER